MRYELTTRPQQESYTGTSLSQLTLHLQKVQLQPYLQIWVHNTRDQSIGAYFNQDFALIHYFNEHGNSAHAFDPEKEGANSTHAIHLENGQVDEFPESDFLSRQQGMKALLFFFEHGNRPDWLHWQEH